MCCRIAIVTIIEEFEEVSWDGWEEGGFWGKFGEERERRREVLELATSFLERTILVV